MAGITGAVVKKGDILLCKSYSLMPTGTHFGIRAGQYVTQVVQYPFHLFDKDGQSNTVHAQISVSAGADPVDVAESSGSGVTLGQNNVEAVVYRLAKPGHAVVASTAAAVAEEIVNNAVGQATGHYNYGRSAFSVLRFLYYGSSAKELNRQVDEGTYTNGYFCSMFVTVCYQVAAKRCGVPVPTILNGDAMNMSPMDLESYLRTQSGTWSCIGTLNEPTGNFAERWKTRLFTREGAH